MPCDPASYRGTKARLLLLIIAVLLTLVVVEGGWRVYLFHFASQRHLHKWAHPEDLPAHVAKYRPHPYLAYSLNPDFRSEDGLSRHNSLGPVTIICGNTDSFSEFAVLEPEPEAEIVNPSDCVTAPGGSSQLALLLLPLLIAGLYRRRSRR